MREKDAQRLAAKLTAYAQDIDPWSGEDAEQQAEEIAKDLKAGNIRDYIDYLLTDIEEERAVPKAAALISEIADCIA